MQAWALSFSYTFLISLESPASLSYGEKKVVFARDIESWWSSAFLKELAFANPKTQTLYSYHDQMIKVFDVPSQRCVIQKGVVWRLEIRWPCQEFFGFVVKPWLSCSHKEREGIFCGLNEQLCQSYPPTRKCAKVSRGYPLLQILRHLSYLTNTHKSESTSSFQSSQGSWYVRVEYWPQGKAIVWGKWLKISHKKEQRIMT